jgi:hypothetical protein
MSDRRRTGHPARFIRVVGWAYGAAGLIGLLVGGAQAALPLGGAPGFALDTSTRAKALGFAAASLVILIVSIAFLKRRRWARLALMVVTGLAFAGSLIALFAPSAAIEPAPPEAPAAYARLLRMASTANVVVPLVVCAALGWILWRLRSPAIGDQFR